MKKIITFLLLINLLTFELFSEESMQYSDAIEEMK